MNQVQPTTTQYQGASGEDPTSPPWATGNYVGPYWSDGKFQESVEFGDAPALHELDALARLHDTAYARYKDDKHRAAADLIFAQEAEKLKRKYGNKWAEDPKVAAAFVQYGNHIKRAATRVGSNVTTGFKFGGLLGALGGLVYSGAQNIHQAHQMTNGTYLKQELADIGELYASDPKKLPANAVSKTKKKTLLDSVKDLVISRPKVAPAPQVPVDHSDWATKQAARFRKFNALRDAAEASVGKPIVRKRKKKKKNYASALPDFHKKNLRKEQQTKKLKRISVRPA